MPHTIDKVKQSGDDVLDILHSVMHQVRSRQSRWLREEALDITHMDSRVLGFFGRHPGATQSDLAVHSGRDKAQLARLVKGLRDRGLLAAEADVVDRRNVRLTLTAQGRVLQDQLRGLAARLGDQAVAGLSAEECRVLAGLLRRVQVNLGEGE